MIINPLEYLNGIDIGKIQEICFGNYRIGSCEVNGCLVDVRYVTNREYSKTLLIDDAWKELKSISKCCKKINIYILSEDINSVTDVFYLNEDLLKTTCYSEVIKLFCKFRDAPIELQENILKLDLPHFSGFNKPNSTCPMVSIVTTVFNNSEQLEQTIQSVINQDAYSHVEYIIKDAGSKDNFIDVVNKYKNVISIVESQKDNGIYDGMQRGILLSKGKYFAILNSGDIYRNSDVISTFIRAFKTDKDFYYSHFDIALNGSYVTRQSKIGNLWRKTSLQQATFFSKRTLFDEIRGFNLKLSISADWYYYIDLIKRDCTSQQLNLSSIIFRTDGTSSHWKFIQLKENLICCFHYAPWNILGALANIVTYLKNMVR